METTIHNKCQKLSKDHVEAEFAGWILDPRYSRTCDTKIFRLTELYWLNKVFITQIVEEWESQYQDILQRLHVMDKKFGTLCRIFSIEITMHNYLENQMGSKEENDKLKTLKGHLRTPFG